MHILEVENLSKSFSKNPAVKNVSFTVDEGEIVALVGPNGAGKTTTLKLITNLIFPDTGKISVAGYDTIKNREQALACMTAIIETPSLYTYLSGMENLRFFQKVHGIPDEELRRVIQTVGLEKQMQKKVKKYSLGMKQRLGLGVCLLSRPRLLILDEPANGLDPTSLIELRGMLRDFACHRHIAVLYSSHMLSEVQKVANRVIFIKDGEIAAMQSMEGAAEWNYKMRVKDSQAAVEALSKLAFAVTTAVDPVTVLVSMREDRLYDLMCFLVENEIAFTGFEAVQSNLEAQYKKIFGGD